MFSTYKTPALVNLDMTPTFTPVLLRKDLDLGLRAARARGVPIPVTAITREVIQQLIGSGVTEQDFAMLLQHTAKLSGLTLEPENVEVGDGL
jgi:3-hydroxyisobutyrate dehydrogenase-like beta-hydroxyacid dehydrogenase